MSQWLLAADQPGDTGWKQLKIGTLFENGLRVPVRLRFALARSGANKCTARVGILIGGQCLALKQPVCNRYHLPGSAVRNLIAASR